MRYWNVDYWDFPPLLVLSGFLPQFFFPLFPLFLPNCFCLSLIFPLNFYFYLFPHLFYNIISQRRFSHISEGFFFSLTEQLLSEENNFLASNLKLFSSLCFAILLWLNCFCWSLFLCVYQTPENERMTLMNQPKAQCFLKFWMQTFACSSLVAFFG